MYTLEYITQEKEILSRTISTQVRTVSLSLIILIGAILIGITKPELDITQGIKNNLFLNGILVLLTLFFDYLQYLCGYLCASETQKRARNVCGNKVDYNRDAFKFKCWRFFFGLKQIFMFVAVIYFIIIIIICLF